MFRIIVLFMFVNANLANATTLNCQRDSDSSKGSVVLKFDGTRLLTAEVTGTGIKGMNHIVFDRKNSQFSTGSNSAEKFQHITRKLPELSGPEIEASLSYKIQVHGKNLSLKQSLVGPQFAVNGTPYGKLRFDFTIPGAFDDDGWTYHYYCK